MIADNFDPNGVGLKNGNFIGLPFEFENSKIVLFPVPWDVTVSYSAGTSLGPQNILNESVQLDLHDIDVENAWRSGIYFQEINQDILNKSQLLREKTEKYIDFIENGGNIFSNSEMLELLNEVNSESLILNRWIKDQTSQILDQGKLIGLIGGDGVSN